ncbi:hypothetical protein ACAX78_003655 [Proteus mirabilis]|uniref:hypothetical protein n=1 Tax=Enterobacterales TaxID=91347 RepID=UPI000D6F28E0|nr:MULTISPECIES: hypothetical protein [Enterobacterales]KAB7714811.1 hypothetical protein GBN11_17735 [Proteus mirabilis]MBI6311952.1 hypothetical protein [Proteus mirabilis]MCI9769133.1 hypothetical protein [Proteus mirabilis]MCI9772726.1 hypothetical protein [Proteus mirabilis]MCI9776316.1 hypothetical protein [Proteus mirabilis]
MTVLRQEKNAIIEKLNTVFTGVTHHGGTGFIQPKKDGEMTEKIFLRLSKVAILSALYGCLTKNQTVISGKNDGGNPPSFF